MRRLIVLLLLVCLALPLAACGGAQPEIRLTPLDPAATLSPARSESPVRIETVFGPAVPAVLPTPEPTPEFTQADADAPSYVLNTSSRRFHRPDCASVAEMKETNRALFTGSREELIAQGYTPCGRCNP